MKPKPASRPRLGVGGAPLRPKGWIALTGTPGTGKSSTVRQLGGQTPVVELRTLALTLGAGRRRIDRGIDVDLPALRRAFRRYVRGHPTGIVVGHLAHFLPVSGVVVLRCHPAELARRLRRSRRSGRERNANVLSEALDIVLVEALAQGVPVHEIDTTGRTVASVARTVRRIVSRRGPARFGRVNWLADPRVTEELLRRAR
jgi:adenylate kinase